MKKVENNNPEVKEIKARYKKLRKNILLVLFVILVIYIVNLSIKTIKIQSLFKANLSETLGDNYKITRTDNGGSVINFKDGVKLQVNRDIAGTLSYDNKGYVINFETKEYWDVPLEVSVFTRKNMVVSNCMSLESEDVNSFFKMAKYIIWGRMKLGSEEINGKNCYTLSIDNNSMKMWFDKESKLIVKEGYSGNISEVEIEIGTVTNEDIKLPWELGFIKRESNNQ